MHRYSGKKYLKATLASFLSLFLLSSSLFAQVDILVIDYNNGFNSDRSNNNSRVYNRLSATQGTVNRVNSVPGFISNVTYDQVWIYGNPGGASGATLNPIVNFINGGGGVYMQSEVSCCNNMGAFVEDVMQNTVAGGFGMTHNPNVSGYYRWSTSGPTSCPGISHYGAACRLFFGMGVQNRYYIAQSGCGTVITPPDVLGVAFRSCDMTSGNGALVSSGDFNMWISSSTCGGVGIIGTANRNDMIDLTVNLISDLVQCGSCGIVLPVEIADFTATPVGDAVQLDWATTMESGNAFFTVERSRDGVDFNSIDRVDGAGNSDQRIDYQVTDKNPLNGTSYYRLQQTDFNGETSFSEVRTVTFGIDAGMVAYHRSSDRMLVVENLPDDLLKLELLNVAGQVMAVQPRIHDRSATFATGSVAAGVYMVRATTRSSQPIVKKIMIME